MKHGASVVNSRPKFYNAVGGSTSGFVASVWEALEVPGSARFPSLSAKPKTRTKTVRHCTGTNGYPH